MHLIPFGFRSKTHYQKILQILFFLFNIPALAFNFIDFIYFGFTLKRTTSDIFKWTGLGNDLKTLIPKFMHDFWYVFLLFFAMIWMMAYLYKKTRLHLQHISKETTFQRPLLGLQLVYMALFILLMVVGVRGGMQLRPLSILSASEGISPSNIALVLNTPFTIIQTLEKDALKEVKYMSSTKASALFNIYKTPSSTDSLKRLNVVILILESFSKEYSGSLNAYKGYTPFLDSLLNESLVYTEAFANGKKSIEGIPAIVAGIPTLMESPYITSSYSGNQINSIASLLKKQGYSTSFFHGGTNGTMGFDHFAKMAGFEAYYGRNEFKNDRDYDGTWGIYDEPFLQFMAQKLNKTQQPFVGCCFTLSSHHPYAIPDKYTKTFKKGTLEIHQSIEYADFALRQFFKTASKMPWFQNTLFVITADHSSLSEYPVYQTSLGSYRIPISFYHPGSDLKGRDSEVVQQLDILPSVLDYIQYPEPFISFGESVFRKNKMHAAVNYMSNVYQYIEKEYVLQFNGEKSIGLYAYHKDSLLQNNLVAQNTRCRDSLEKRLKAIIQTYNYTLIHNRMIVLKKQ
jgi:phosphoglycerol transferase MdoB-like AlkP superfamily enzyme